MNVESDPRKTRGERTAIFAGTATLDAEMPRICLFQENIYPILVRELARHENVLRKNNKKALKEILNTIIIGGTPLSEWERSSVTFIETNRERILGDIETIKRNPTATLHHPLAPTYPPKMRLVATALLTCADQFRSKDYNSVFRSSVKKEAAGLMSKSGLRVTNLENYFTDYRDRLLELMDDIEAERRHQVDKENRGSSSNESRAVTDQKDESSGDKRQKDTALTQSVSPDKALLEDESAQGAAVSPGKLAADARASPKKEASKETHQQVSSLATERATSPVGDAGPGQLTGGEATAEATQRPAKSEGQNPDVSISSKDSKKVLIENEDASQLEETLKLPEGRKSQEAQVAVQNRGEHSPMEVESPTAKNVNSSEDEEFAGFRASEVNGSVKDVISQGAKSSGSAQRIPEPFKEDDSFLELRVLSLELNEWSVGQLAWAPITDFVYWPCIVVADHTGGQVRTQHFGDKTVTLIHVKYFGKNGGYSWVNKNSLIECSGPDDVDRMAEIFTAAIEELQQMMKRDTTERIVALGGRRKRMHPSSQETNTKRMRLDGKKMEV